MSFSKVFTLTIVIPAYNEENHLQACLDSISQQTTLPTQVIVVDNNSADRTVKIAKTYPFVRVISEKKQGVVFARNTGFNAVKTELIGRIDADTVLPVNWVERVYNFYSNREHDQTALTGGAYFYNMKFGKLAGWIQGQIAFRVNRLLLGHYILYGSNMVLPSSVWKKVRYVTCEEGTIHEDIDLAIHIHAAGFPIAYQEGMKVGVKMRRVFSDREQLRENLFMWPKTLRHHHLKSWIFGWLGAAGLYVFSFLSILFKKDA